MSIGIWNFWLYLLQSASRPSNNLKQKRLQKRFYVGLQANQIKAMSATYKVVNRRFRTLTFFTKIFTELETSTDPSSASKELTDISNFFCCVSCQIPLVLIQTFDTCNRKLFVIECCFWYHSLFWFIQYFRMFLYLFPIICGVYPDSVC